MRSVVIIITTTTTTIIIIIISSSSSTHGGDNEWRQPRGHPPQQHLNPTLIDPTPNIAVADGRFIFLYCCSSFLPIPSTPSATAGYVLTISGRKFEYMRPVRTAGDGASFRPLAEST